MYDYPKFDYPKFNHYYDQFMKKWSYDDLLDENRKIENYEKSCSNEYKQAVIEALVMKYEYIHG